MSYKLLPDTATADVMFEASGKSLDAVFESACLATTEVMVDLKTINPKTAITFEKSNPKLEGLLYDVLDELVFLKDSKTILFCHFKVKVTEGKPNTAQITADGQVIDQKTMRLHNDIKAITWHLFELKKQKSGWIAKVLVDV